MTRRELLHRIGSSLVAITVSSPWGPISPAKARANGVPLRNLSFVEARILEALGDVLLPGAREAGLAHYVDDQLGRGSPLLFLKYMDYDGSHVEFYKQGLQSLERQSLLRQGHAFGANGEQDVALVRELSQRDPPGWSGPPAPLFYFVTRNDAVGVYYGTPDGFEKLAIPYMPHIVPPAKW